MTGNKETGYSYILFLFILYYKTVVQSKYALCTARFNH